MITKPRVLIALALVLLALILALQNRGQVELRFLIWQTAVSRLILLPAVFLVGAAAGSLFTAALVHSGAKKEKAKLKG